VTTHAQLDVVTALRRAAVRATLAPSVHNTQPWRFLLSPDAVELYADRSRQLSVLDPAGRQLVISCGCALSNMRVALAGIGFRGEVARFPDPLRRDLLARVTVRGTSAEPDPLAALDGVMELRRSNRRRFADEPVPAEVVRDLVAAAAAENAMLFPIHKPEHRLITASLSQQADRAQWADPGYRAELRRWTTNNVRRLDGVSTDAVPRVDGSAEDDIPIRDFDATGDGALPATTRSTMRQCLLLLGTRQELGLRMNPHVLLRVGRAPLTPATRRRRLVDVLSDQPPALGLSRRPHAN
jgi:hypothetical protein